MRECSVTIMEEDGSVTVFTQTMDIPDGAPTQIAVSRATWEGLMDHPDVQARLAETGSE